MQFSEQGHVTLRIAMVMLVVAGLVTGGVIFSTTWFSDGAETIRAAKSNAASEVDACETSAKAALQAQEERFEGKIDALNARIKSLKEQAEVSDDIAEQAAERATLDCRTRLRNVKSQMCELVLPNNNNCDFDLDDVLDEE